MRVKKPKILGYMPYLVRFIISLERSFTIMSGESIPIKLANLYKKAIVNG